jgi:uncharacterized protein (DUF1501 family)
MPARDPFKGCDDFRTAHRPATGFNRRRLLMRAAGAGLSYYAARAIAPARMLEAALAQGPEAPVLVSVFLPGGCDLLSTLTPLDQNGRLNDLRRSLGTTDAAPLAGESRLGLHAGLGEGLNGGVRGLFEAGKVGFLPGIDYANPDLSHFHSRHFWETGLITQTTAPGWLGRWLDRHGSADNPLQGLSLGGGMSPVLQTAGAPVASLDSPGDAKLTFAGTWDVGERAALDAWSRLAAEAPGGRPGPDAAKRSAALVRTVSDRLSPYIHDDDDTSPDPLAPPVAYPKGDFADRLQRLAGLIALPLGVRVANVEAPGDFDTHDDQPKQLADALGEVSQALAAFQADLEARGVADRVLTFVWSEFGRRPESNDSKGTDHGAGGIAWVQGTRARGGVLTDYPDLGRLDGNDNLAVTVDFRRVYCSLLEQWMGTDATEIIPRAETFGRLAVTR